MGKRSKKITIRTKSKWKIIRKIRERACKGKENIYNFKQKL